MDKVLQPQVYSLIALAACYKALNDAAHIAHLKASRVSFFQDHAFFAEIYEYADSQYDGLIERHIGLNGDLGVDIKEINMKVMEKLQTFPNQVKENADFYRFIKGMLDYIQSEIKKLASGVSLGTNNYLAQLADDIEKFNYKINQRIKK